MILSKLRHCSSKRNLKGIRLKLRFLSMGVDKEVLSDEHYTKGATFRRKLLSELQYHPLPIIQKNCPSCGVILQNDNPNKIGFLPTLEAKVVKDEEDLSTIPPMKLAICQRCFSIQTYNKLLPVQVPYSDFEKILIEQRNRDVLIVKVMDLFNFSGSVIPNFAKIIGSKKVVLIVNKIDLLPPKTSTARLERWVRTQAKENGINTVESVFFVSARTWFGLKEAWKEIAAKRGGRDVIICGMANVGKSSLVNNILRMLYPKEKRVLQQDVIKRNMIEKEMEMMNKRVVNENEDIEKAEINKKEIEDDMAEKITQKEEEEVEEEKNEVFEVDEEEAIREDAYFGDVPEPVLVSPFPNTTLGVCKVPLDRKSFLFDTPGIAPAPSHIKMQNFFLSGTSQERKMLIPKDRHVKPVTYHLKNNKTILIGSIARLDWQHEGDRDILITSFFPNDIYLHELKTESAVEKINKHKGVLFVPPIGVDRANEMGDMKQVLSFPLQHVKLLAGEGAASFARFREERKEKEDNTLSNKRYLRTALFDLCFGHLGWMSVTVPAYDKSFAYWNTIDKGIINAFTVNGISVEVRSPLLPFEASGKSGKGSTKYSRPRSFQSFKPAFPCNMYIFVKSKRM